MPVAAPLAPSPRLPRHRRMPLARLVRRRLGALTASGVMAVALIAPATPAQAATTDPFFTYTGATPLSSYANGTVLKTRTVTWHILGGSVGTKAVQIVYKSTDARGRAVHNVTSVLKPTWPNGKVASYQSAYDSLNPEHSPSRSIAGEVSLGGVINDAETALVGPMLAKGYTVVVTDTEGQRANFAAGPEYGQLTLDALRAVKKAGATTGVAAGARIGLIGYSGGAIATNWAAALAPTYAPDVNASLVGAAEGGVLVAPAHNLRYVNGSTIWAGVAPMAVIGVARAYGLDLNKYANDRGKALFAAMSDDSIVQVLGQYPGLRWEQLVKPEYADPTRIPEFVDAVNKTNMGLAPRPTVPMFIAQAAAGELEGTWGGLPGIGRGDGVMIAGDVRTLARRYCAGGTKVRYDQYDLSSHVSGFAVWAPAAMSWLDARFGGWPMWNSCGLIPAGNSLAAEVYRAS